MLASARQAAAGALPWSQAMLPMVKTKMMMATSGKMTPTACAMSSEGENGARCLRGGGSGAVDSVPSPSSSSAVDTGETLPIL